MLLALDNLRLDGGTQPRAETDATVVERYATVMQAGDEFPPVPVYFDGSNYWLAGGFHRVHARRLAEFFDIDAEIRQGTLRDAVLFSVGENAKHGLPRTADDRRRAVCKLLEDPEWRTNSDEWVATCAQVEPKLVASLRAELYPASPDNPEIRTAHRGSQTYTMTTRSIGTRLAPEVYAGVGAPQTLGHREREDRSRFIAVGEALRAILAAQDTLPSPQVAAAEVGAFDIDRALGVAAWWTKFAAHQRQRAGL